MHANVGGKSEGRRLHGKSTSSYRKANDIIADLKNTRFPDVNWIFLAQVRDQ
jgi:hypothetical protein